MTTLTFKNALPAETRSVGHGIGLIAALRREWSYVAAARALNRLDDAALQDVGVARGNIDDAVRHGR